jgi:hypothetical protein
MVIYAHQKLTKCDHSAQDQQNCTGCKVNNVVGERRTLCLLIGLFHHSLPDSAFSIGNQGCRMGLLHSESSMKIHCILLQAADNQLKPGLQMQPL